MWHSSIANEPLQSLVYTRSEIRLKDEATKFGTDIDGNKIKGETKTLRNDEHTFKLGKSGHIFRYVRFFALRAKLLIRIAKN